MHNWQGIKPPLLLHHHHCPFGVTRKGNGTANVTIKKPDGRKRVIFFEKGKAIAYDVNQADPGAFSASKQSDLFMKFQRR
jgi:hypothetical protein